MALNKAITDLYPDRIKNQFSILNILDFSAAIHLSPFQNTSLSFCANLLASFSSRVSGCFSPSGICPSLFFFFYVLFLHEFTLFQGFKYPFYIDISQMSTYNWSFSPDLWIHIFNYFLTSPFRYLTNILNLTWPKLPPQIYPIKPFPSQLTVYKIPGQNPGLILDSFLPFMSCTHISVPSFGSTIKNTSWIHWLLATFLGCYSLHPSYHYLLPREMHWSPSSTFVLYTIICTTSLSDLSKCINCIMPLLNGFLLFLE